jgi:DNA mismatch endonuclease Vsr
MQRSDRYVLFTGVSDGRRRIMRSIKSKDTGPERLVRSLLHRLGYRFRKNLKGLPGRPDVALTGRQKAVFVHGCFWHAHEGCKKSTIPQTRREYWTEKLKRNVARDARNLCALREAGWAAEVIWECELEDVLSVSARLARFLGPPRGSDRRDAQTRNGSA